jgi:allantoicase
VYPDGGLARLRLYGDLGDQGRATLGLRWLNSLPAGQAGQVLTDEYGLDQAEAERVVASRPAGDLDALPDRGRALLAGRARP